jgi:hypothetical protein
MTAPERRRPLPALALIGALCLLTAVVWFRVIHRSDGSTPQGSGCSTRTASPSPSASHTATTRGSAPTVLPRPSAVSVLVLNSTARSGIAKATKRALLAREFKVVEATNDTRTYGGHGTLPGVAEVRYGPKGVAAATLVHLYFPGSVMREVHFTSTVVAVSLGRKYKAVATNATVAKVMTQRHLKFGTIAPTPTPSPSC